jgi:hypothetical protein
LEEDVDNAQRDIDKFLRAVTKQNNLETLTKSIKEQQRSRNDTCLRPWEFAAHLIVDLYDEASDDTANVNRIVGNLENAADELLTFSRRIQTLARK